MDLAYQNLIVGYIYKVLIHGSVYMVARNLLFRLTNSSVVSDSNQNSTGISLADLNVLRQEQEQSYKHHINMLVLHLQENAGTYPEYYQSDDEGLDAQAQQDAILFYYDGEEIVE